MSHRSPASRTGSGPPREGDLVTHIPIPMHPLARVLLPLNPAAALAIAACGGGGTGPSDSTPAPVATVVVSPATLVLAPQQQQQLAATLRDAGGHALAGRAVSWTSSDPARASVSLTGLVTALTPGEVTISATSEGRTGTASVSVIGPATLPPAGGTAVLAGGAVTVVAPPGAVAVPTTLTAVETPSPTTMPPGWQAVGPLYTLGPPGSTFAQPVTVTLKYAATDLPAFAMSGDLAILHRGAGQWSNLSDIVVDTAARTISGRTTSFSDFGVAAQDPEVRLSPQRGSINAQQRSITIYAIIPARGGTVPLPQNTPPLRYRWWTTGANGALDRSPSEWTTEAKALYTSTNPVLNQLSGPIDEVYAEVLLNPESLDGSSGEAPRTRTVQAVIDADLAATYEISPDQAVIDRGQSKNLGLLIRDKQGQQMPLPGNRWVAWSTSGTHGSIPTTTDRRQLSVTYTAKSSFPVPPPRIDEVIASVWEQRTITSRQPRLLAGMVVGWDDVSRLDSSLVVAPSGTVEVRVPYTVTLTASSTRVSTQGSVSLEVALSPDNTGPGILFKYQNSGGWGALSVPLGVPTEVAQLTYTAGPLAGGSDVVTVEAVSVIQGVERAVLAQAQVTIRVEGPPAFTEIVTASGGLHTCALTADGEAWCWGRNHRGQLGDGTQARRMRPVRVSTNQRFTAIAAGVSHTCALTASGAAWCWGDHTFGQTGDGGPYGPQYPPRLTPVAVQGPSFSAITAGNNTTCGRTGGGQVACWGGNLHTQIGNGNSENQVTPVTVMSGAGRVSVGSFHTCATPSPAGPTRCWGDNGKDDEGYNVDYSPQVWGPNLLGAGLTQRQVMSPTIVSGPVLHGVSVGTGFSCGWEVTGVAHCRGLNAYGQLGDGTTTWRSSSAPVNGAQTFTLVSAGGSHACGLNLLKEIWCWGRNHFGQLGDGTNLNRTAPVRVMAAGVQFTSVSSGATTTCAIASSGEAWCWGGNTEGQVGDGTQVPRNLPVLIKP